MNILFVLGHPAHYHLLKNTYNILKQNGHSVHYAITPKDILIHLLESNKEEYSILAQRGLNESFFGKVVKLYKSTLSLNKISKSMKAELIIGSLSQVGFTSKLIGIPSIFVGEDDFLNTWAHGLLTYPFVSCILAPKPSKLGPFEYKKISYNAYQKLAYLHPRWFTPDQTKLTSVLTEKFFILRFSKFDAYHDVNAKGIDNSVAQRLVGMLEPLGQVLITSERELPAELEKYRFKGNVGDIHHYLFFANIFIGDSQSMAVESAMLGTPNIRFNYFAENYKVSVLDEIEEKYSLTISINSKKTNELFATVRAFLKDKELKASWSQRRANMLKDKIDPCLFFNSFISDFPNSMKEAFKVKNNK